MQDLDKQLEGMKQNVTGLQVWITLAIDLIEEDLANRPGRGHSPHGVDRRNPRIRPFNHDKVNDILENLQDIHIL